MNELKKVIATIFTYNYEPYIYFLEYSMLKKMYQEQKSALHVAKNLYETSFGIRINVTDKTCNDKFTATVCCHEENFPVKFLMSRTSRTVTGSKKF